MQVIKYQAIATAVADVKTIEEMKKTVKPDFKVDINMEDTPVDIFAKYGAAKQKAGLPMTDRELESIISKHEGGKTYIEPEFEAINLRDDEKVVIKKRNGKLTAKVVKKNIFKRFWYWIVKK